MGARIPTEQRILLSLHDIDNEVLSLKGIKPQPSVPRIVAERRLGRGVDVGRARVELEVGIEHMLSRSGQRVEQQRVIRSEVENLARVSERIDPRPPPIAEGRLAKLRIIDV